MEIIFSLIIIIAGWCAGTPAVGMVFMCISGMVCNSNSKWERFKYLTLGWIILLSLYIIFPVLVFYINVV